MSTPAEPSPLIDEDAERAVIGAVLADNDVIWRVSPVVSPKDFGKPAHGMIWEAVLGLHQGGQDVDHLTLAEELKTRGQLASVGGPAYLMGLDQVVPVAANAGQYAEVVKDRARRRRTQAIAKRLLSAAGDLSVDPLDLLGKAAAELAKVGAGTVRFRTLREVNEAAYREMNEIQESGKEPIILTGLKTWDSAIGGVQPHVIIIGGKPGNGKSALVAALCRGIAMGDTTVGLFSVEDPADWLTYRYLAAFSGVPNFILRYKKKTDAEWAKIGPASEHLGGPFSDRIIIDDTPRITSRDLVARAEDMIRNYGVRVIVVDHLQELDHQIHGGEREDQRFRESLGELRAVANRHKVPVIVFAQCKSEATGTPNAAWFGNAKDAINQVARVQAILELNRESGKQVIHFIKHTNGQTEFTIELGFVAGAAMVRDMPGEEKLEHYRRADTEFEPMPAGGSRFGSQYVEPPEEDDKP